MKIKVLILGIVVYLDYLSCMNESLNDKPMKTKATLIPFEKALIKMMCKRDGRDFDKTLKAVEKAVKKATS